jgi:hypothetical protein
MTIVNAYQIVKSLELMYPAFGEENKPIAVVVSASGQERCVQTIDDFIDRFEWDVGDWVVVWPNGFKNIQKMQSFHKNFKHIDGVRYETEFKSLF